MAVQHSSNHRRRGLRTAPLLWAACLSSTLSGCWATKNDARKLQTDIFALRAREDSLANEAARQNRVLADSLRAISDATRYLQGNLTNQIKSLQDLVLQVQALLGQSQQRISELREQLDRQAQQQQQATQPVQPGGNSPEELYQAGLDRLPESPAQARFAFQTLLSEFPTATQAADAQFYIAETYVAEKDTAMAFREFERVAAAYGTSPRAPEALYRAGVVAEENRARARARGFYNRVIKEYASSDAARTARQRLNQLRD
jgi:TolA-binding protein